MLEVEYIYIYINIPIYNQYGHQVWYINIMLFIDLMCEDCWKLLKSTTQQEIHLINGAVMMVGIKITHTF